MPASKHARRDVLCTVPLASSWCQPQHCQPRVQAVVYLVILAAVSTTFSGSDILVVVDSAINHHTWDFVQTSASGALNLNNGGCELASRTRHYSSCGYIQWLRRIGHGLLPVDSWCVVQSCAAHPVVHRSRRHISRRLNFGKPIQSCVPTLQRSCRRIRRVPPNQLDECGKKCVPLNALYYPSGSIIGTFPLRVVK